MPIFKPADFLRELAEEYQKDPNPLLAWEALDYALRLHLPVPAVVAEYFVNCTQKLRELTAQRPNRGADVARLLGLSDSTGQSSPFLRYSSRLRDESIALDARGGYPPTSGISRTDMKESLAQRHGVSVRTIERVLNDYADLIQASRPLVRLVSDTK